MAQIVPGLAPGVLPDWLQCPFDMPPSFRSFEYCLAFWCFPFPSLESATPPKSPVAFIGEWYLETQAQARRSEVTF